MDSDVDSIIKILLTLDYRQPYAWAVVAILSAAVIGMSLRKKK